MHCNFGVCGASTIPRAHDDDDNSHCYESLHLGCRESKLAVAPSQIKTLCCGCILLQVAKVVVVSFYLALLVLVMPWPERYKNCLMYLSSVQCVGQVKCYSENGWGCYVSGVENVQKEMV